ncbi:SGNH/GDSL hydrolase family protein [Bounagaea algeriensis]
MRYKSRWFRSLACGFAVALGVAGSTGAAAAEPVAQPAVEPAMHYAALGDSYASGVGTGEYDPGSGDCKRGPLAYPALWAQQHDPAEFDFVACGGATTEDVTGAQLSALDAATDLVTVSAGGNDIGFAGTVTACLLGTEEICDERVAEGEQRARGELPAALDETYRAIAEAAPNAQVLVLGYPRLTEPGACPVPGFTEHKRERLNAGADVLSDVIEQAAQRAGFDYLDVRSAFDGHGVCGEQEWINGPDVVVSESFHPNSTGHESGYLPVLDAAVE